MASIWILSLVDYVHYEGTEVSILGYFHSKENAENAKTEYEDALGIDNIEEGNNENYQTYFSVEEIGEGIEEQLKIEALRSMMIYGVGQRNNFDEGSKAHLWYEESRIVAKEHSHLSGMCWLHIESGEVFWGYDDAQAFSEDYAKYSRRLDYGFLPEIERVSIDDIGESIPTERLWVSGDYVSDKRSEFEGSRFDKAKLMTLEDMGWLAHKDGYEPHQNPFPEGSIMAILWMIGWNNGEAKCDPDCDWV